MNNKVSLTIFSLALGMVFNVHSSYAGDTYNSKKTTTVETTTQSTTTAPRPVARPAKKPEVTTTSSTTTLVTKEGDIRKVLDEDDLKKMSKSLCVTGFKAYVGGNKKNVCQDRAAAPNIAYSCVWTEEGDAAYAPTAQGPCGLDYSEHQGSIIIAKSDYASSPPLRYGTEAQCCVRAARGPSTSTMVTSPTTTVAPK